jgi:membrane-associated phospholipid phosphatase
VQEEIKFKLIIGFLVILALAVSIYSKFTPRFPGDLYLTLYLQSLDNNSLLSFMKCVSMIFGGWFSVLVVVTIGILVWWRIGRLEAIMILVGGLLTLVNAILKLAVSRPRPSSDLIRVLSPEQGYSFPSGHALFAIVVLGLLAYYLYINVKGRALQTLVTVGLIALILLIGASRVYLGAHWPSDILGGYLVGGVLLTGLIWFYKIWERRHYNKTSA